MNNPSDELNEDLPNWLPFTCPSCRGLFRVSANQKGPAQCPLCGEALAINLPESAAPERRRRRSSSAQSRQATWEGEASPEQQDKSSTRWVGFVAAGSILCILAALTAVALAQKFQREPVPEETTARAKKLQAAFQKNSGDEGEPLVTFTHDDSKAAAAVARKFLEAATLDDLLPLIRNSEELAPVIRAHHRQSGYKAPGAYKLEEEAGTFKVKDRFTSFDIIMGDYSKRPIALELTEEGPLVDWESWVGFCEMPWEKFIAQRTSLPTLVRVYVEKVFYYNFDFGDDSQWACFRLSRGADEPALFGYCPQDSPLLEKLPRKPESISTYILNVRFPDDAKNGEQVIITDVVNLGWVSGLGQ